MEYAWRCWGPVTSFKIADILAVVLDFTEKLMQIYVVDQLLFPILWIQNVVRMK